MKIFRRDVLRGDKRMAAVAIRGIGDGTRRWSLEDEAPDTPRTRLEDNRIIHD
nr:hypothetical protein [Burkholderia gladioli]